MSLAVETGQIVDDGATVRLPDFIVRFTPAQQSLVDRLISQIQADPINTPSVKDSAGLIGADVLQALFDAGTLIQVSPDVLFDAETLESLTGQVRDFVNQHGSITVAQARDLLNSSRKYVLALLEYLDEQKVTKREGDARTLR
jgi:selenocysteine-specific elongation factor